MRAPIERVLPNAPKVRYHAGMETSSIYLTCPGCAGNTLIERRGAICLCAACGFDYSAFRSDTVAFEQYLVDRMREGPAGQLGAAALNQWTSKEGAAASAAHLRALGERHGVGLPAPMNGDPILRAGLAVVALIVVLVVSLVGYFVFLGAE